MSGHHTAVALPERAAVGDRRTPRVDIIGIGVQRAATTWLFRCLIDHPQVRPAARPPVTVKEINFFNRYWERGHAWYDSLFDFGSWKTAEYSVLYFHDRNVPPRLHRYNPAARLILAIRNPIDRAYSHHKHEVRQGRVPAGLLEFRAALERNPSYIEQGRYATHLERWLEHFELDRIHIIEHHEIEARREQVVRGLYDFAGVDPSHRPVQLHERINRAIAERSTGVTRVIRSTTAAVRAIGGDRAVRAVKATGFPAWLRRRNQVLIDERVVPPLTEEDRAFLAEVFAGENERLSRMTGKDISNWI